MPFLEKTIIGSLVPIEANKVIERCEFLLKKYAKKRDEEVEAKIQELMCPRKFLFFTKTPTREQAISEMKERNTIGAIELNSMMDDIEIYWLNKKVNLEGIAKMAQCAIKQGRSEMFLDKNDVRILEF